jgi:uncharacterized membrane protein (UPF0127 family)
MAPIQHLTCASVATSSSSATSATRRTGLSALAAVGAIALVGLALSACDDRTRAGVEQLTINGKVFYLELADTPAKRFRGLSERTQIAPDGGMLFTFPDDQVVVQGFVMRDCPIPIDIIYLDPQGRVLTWYAMTPEPPRDPAKGEGTPADPNNIPYNLRLKQYSSRFPSQFVLELRGGTLEGLALKEGLKLNLDVDRLKRGAR